MYHKKQKYCSKLIKKPLQIQKIDNVYKENELYEFRDNP